MQLWARISFTIPCKADPVVIVYLREPGEYTENSEDHLGLLERMKHSRCGFCYDVVATSALVIREVLSIKG